MDRWRLGRYIANHENNLMLWGSEIKSPLPALWREAGWWKVSSSKRTESKRKRVDVVYTYIQPLSNLECSLFRVQRTYLRIYIVYRSTEFLQTQCSGFWQADELIDLSIIDTNIATKPTEQNFHSLLINYSWVGPGVAFQGSHENEIALQPFSSPIQFWLIFNF